MRGSQNEFQTNEPTMHRQACVKDDDEISTLVQNNSKSIGTSVGSNSTTTSRDIGDEDVAKGAAAEAAAEAKALAEAYQTVVDSILRGEDVSSFIQIVTHPKSVEQDLRW